MNHTENYGFNKPERTEFYDVDDFNENMDVLDKKLKELETPEYTEATTLTKLTVGEKISDAFGKIAKAVSTLISHIALKASSSTAGHIKVSSSSAITEIGEYSLDATEKNASIEGTLANQIDSQNKTLTQLNTNLTNKACKTLKISTTINKKDYVDITYDSEQNSHGTLPITISSNGEITVNEECTLDIRILVRSYNASIRDIVAFYVNGAEKLRNQDATTYSDTAFRQKSQPIDVVWHFNTNDKFKFAFYCENGAVNTTDIAGFLNISIA